MVIAMGIAMGPCFSLVEIMLASEPAQTVALR